MINVLLIAAFLVVVTQGHMVAYHKAMYCRDGVSGNNPHNRDISNPLFMLPFEKWWFHAVNGCDKRPPKAGVFLDLPAGGNFTVEMSSTQATTSLSWNGKFTGIWPDGKNYPDDYFDNNTICNNVGLNWHTVNLKTVSGSAFAISYNSDLKDVTPENLVVFTVHYESPWKRLAVFQVPKDMPACPPEGCICAWGWIPSGCGRPDIYHNGYRCRVTNATSTKKVGKGKPPVWCANDQEKCVKGPKQMLYWNQLTGNNIKTPGKNPGYNQKCGFKHGAQNDIFDQ